MRSPWYFSGIIRIYQIFLAEITTLNKVDFRHYIFDEKIKWIALFQRLKFRLKQQLSLTNLCFLYPKNNDTIPISNV